MKVLFVSSGNRSDYVSPIIKNQGDSLLFEKIEVDYYLIRGSGPWGYFKNILPLRHQINKNKYDIIHAHYLFSAIIATFTFKKPMVVSFMGSELFENKLVIFLARFFSRFFWKTTIVKTGEMFQKLKVNGTTIIPNGVDIDRFRPMNKLACQERLKWDSGIKHILFPSWPQRKEKNFMLAKKAVELLETKDIELHTIQDIPNEELVCYYNAADVILFTSFREGSPNVIKEALACNRPIISTKVGDVPWLIDKLENCQLISLNEKEVALALGKALENESMPKGRERITALGLDSQTIAKQLSEIYQKLISKKPQ